MGMLGIGISKPVKTAAPPNISTTVVAQAPKPRRPAEERRGLQYDRERVGSAGQLDKTVSHEAIADDETNGQRRPLAERFKGLGKRTHEGDR